MKKLLYLLISVLLISCTLTSANQDINNIIKGRVIEQKTGKPIPFVNVYLKNTTVGASTDDKGFFVIEKAPRGTYEIIASAIGYHFDIKTVKVEDNKKKTVDFMLRSKTYQLNEVKVEADVNEEWQDRYQIFRREFLGTSRNAGMCIIKNPYQIEFEREGNWLIATSPKPIEVRNEALGYQIDIEIKTFKINLTNDEITYSVLPYYKTLKPKDKTQKEYWKENRNRAYLGSTVHFLRSLAEEKSYENGFIVIPKEIVSPRDAKMEKYLFYNNKEKQNLILKAVVDTVSAIERSLSAKDFLQIVYTKEQEENNYLNSTVGKRFGGNRVNGVQTSWIKVPLGRLFFDIIGSRGEFFSQLDIYGYWGWERLADLVPENYVLRK